MKGNICSKISKCKNVNDGENVNLRVKDMEALTEIKRFNALFTIHCYLTTF